eukprot:Hpha_TRINITY_DN35113_c0_g1::TRINITY_DN35113_c0_g1_i1::g.168460::m.168460
MPSLTPSSPVARLSGCYCVDRDTDTALEKRARRMMLWIAVVMGSVAFVSGIVYLRDSIVPTDLRVVGVHANTIVCIVLLILAFKDWVSPINAMKGLLIFSTLAAIAIDAAVAALLRPRFWSLSVCLLDLGLTFRLGSVTRFTLILTVVWLVVERVEAGFRFGLYDIVQWGDGFEIDRYNCPEPPCAIGGSETFSSLVGFLLVFLFDFYFTRGFAHEMHEQVRRVESAIQVAETVAAALARYDINEAEGAFSTSDLPPELRSSFRTLLLNLRSYRAYLPQSCLVSHEDSLHDGSVSVRSGTHRFAERPLQDRQECEASNQDSSSSFGGSMSESVRSDPAVQGRERARVVFKRASLVALNHTGYIKLAGMQKSADHKDWMEEGIELWCTSVSQARGVVDVVSGDKRFASFNAAQHCPEHSSAAVRVCFNQGLHPTGRGVFEDLRTTGCIVTGQAVCGDFGCEALVRFMVLGPVAGSLFTLERVAALWKVRALADGEARERSQFKWESRLLGGVLLPKRPGLIRLWDMAEERSRGDNHPKEWMYEMEEMEDKFVEHNTDTERLMREQKPNEALAPDVNGGERHVLWFVNDVGMEPC